MRECKQCGFPRRFARFMEWHSDGTVIGSVRPKIPVMFLEVAELEGIFDELSGTIGLPIDHIVIEAQKYIGKDLYDMVKAVYVNIDIRRFPNNRLFRPQWLGKLLVWGMRKDISGLGAGRARVVGYRPGRLLVLGFSDPCLIPMIVGNCLGIYESIEEMPGSNADYGLEDGDLVIWMTPADEKPESEERLYLEEVEAGTGPLAYDRCPICNVPLPVARALEWDIDRGIIRNKLSGEREEMIAVQSVNSILRELENELGSEVLRILYDAQKRYSGDNLRNEEAADPQEFWDRYLNDMAMRGLGYPERFERTDDSLSVDIKTAYDQDLYAAKLAGGLEGTTRRETRIDWELKERHHGAYTITYTS